MGARFHAVSGYARIAPYDRAIMARTCEGMIGQRNAFLWKGNGAMIGAIVFPLFMARAWIAQELFWWSETPGTGRLLFQAYEDWARARSARASIMLAVKDFERMEAVYARAGYAPAERSYLKVL